MRPQSTDETWPTTCSIAVVTDVHFDGVVMPPDGVLGHRARAILHDQEIGRAALAEREVLHAAVVVVAAAAARCRRFRRRPIRRFHPRPSHRHRPWRSWYRHNVSGLPRRNRQQPDPPSSAMTRMLGRTHGDPPSHAMSKPGAEVVTADAALTDGGIASQALRSDQGLSTAHARNQPPGTARSRALCRTTVGKWGVPLVADAWRRRNSNRCYGSAPEVTHGRAGHGGRDER